MHNKQTWTAKGNGQIYCLAVHMHYQRPTIAPDSRVSF